MSQQKFASNVVEKCLTFGGTEERQLLVNEMLGTTEENEPLQVGWTLISLNKMLLLQGKVALSFNFLARCQRFLRM